MKQFSRVEIERSGPMPHYLTSLIVSPDGRSAEGKAIFPLTDPTIAARGDHANLIHLYPAIWNAIHVMKGFWGMKTVRLSSGSWHGFALTVPEAEVKVKIQVLYMAENKKHGTFRAEVFDGENLLFSTTIDFVVVDFLS